MISSFVPFQDGVQAEIQYSLGGLGMSNRLWFLNRQPPTTGLQVQTLADQLFSWWSANVMPLLSFECALLSVLTKSWDDPGSPLVGLSSGFVMGGSGSRSHSANVAIRVSFRWPLSLNLRENSNFIPGIPISEVEVNTYSSSIRDGLFDAYVALIDDAPVFGPFPAYWWVVLSGQDQLAPRSAPVVGLSVGPSFRSPFISPRRYRLR